MVQICIASRFLNYEGASHTQGYYLAQRQRDACLATLLRQIYGEKPQQTHTRNADAKYPQAFRQRLPDTLRRTFLNRNSLLIACAKSGDFFAGLSRVYRNITAGRPQVIYVSSLGKVVALAT